MQGLPCIFCATFRTKLCNTRIKRQDLLGGMVEDQNVPFLLLSNWTMLCMLTCISLHVSNRATVATTVFGVKEIKNVMDILAV